MNMFKWSLLGIAAISLISGTSWGSIIVNDNDGNGFDVRYPPDTRCYMTVLDKTIELGHFNSADSFVHRPTTPYDQKHCTTSFLSESTSINAASPWNGDVSNIMLTFNAEAVVGQYLGLAWEGASGDWYYGWAHIQSANNAAQEYLVSAWAYETEANIPISAGQVPEPATLLLLGLGAIGLLKRRQKA